ncbi:MAG: replication initiation protein [Proteobacteria bacterium]|nr:replication initiation protein [Pseudomonadota bacterium]
MTPREAREKKLQKLQEQKAKPLQKISNNFIQSEIFDLNKNALKTVFYLASILEKFDYSKELNTLEIDLQKMFKYTEMTATDIKNNLRAMQETSITFTDEIEDIEEFIVLIPRIKVHYGKNRVEIDLYSKIAKLILNVKNNYTFLNTKSLMSLENKHSLRFLPILNLISGYDGAKRKRYELQDLNAIFGTKYKNLTDISRYILSPVKTELDASSRLTFLYEIDYMSLGKGRPKATSITIDLVQQKNPQGKLF